MTAVADPWLLLVVWETENVKVLQNTDRKPGAVKEQ